ncbi:MAG: nitrous oxide reductase accessory protein NosL [Ardenticatenales bacterium]
MATLLLSPLVLFAACGPAADPLDPPAIVYGEDVCDACGMIVTDVRFAAATIVEVDGVLEPRRFDDIGDMLAYHAEHRTLSVRRWYVHDHASLAWIDALAAHYVRAAAIRSPMGHGLVAFAERDAADAFARTVSGTVASFEALRRTHGAPAVP